MNDSSQDPVYVEDPINVNFEGQCTLNDHKPESEKIVTIKGTKSISLESLSVEDVCYLLDHCQLSAITTVARENQFSGNILATGVESADDLKEFGMKSMFAQSLFKHIVMWKTNGVPADIFTQRDAATSPAALSTLRITTVGATNIGTGVNLRMQRPSSQGQRSTTKSLPPTPSIHHPNGQPGNTVDPSEAAPQKKHYNQKPDETPGQNKSSGNHRGDSSRFNNRDMIDNKKPIDEMRVPLPYQLSPAQEVHIYNMQVTAAQHDLVYDPASNAMYAFRKGFPVCVIPSKNLPPFPEDERTKTVPEKGGVS